MIGTADEVPGDQLLKYMGDDDEGQGDAGQDEADKTSSSKTPLITQCPTTTGPVARYVEIPDNTINVPKLIVYPIGMICE